MPPDKTDLRDGVTVYPEQTGSGRTQYRIVDEIDDDTLEAVAADLAAPVLDTTPDERRRELVRWAVLSALDDLLALG